MSADRAVLIGHDEQTLRGEDRDSEPKNSSGSGSSNAKSALSIPNAPAPVELTVAARSCAEGASVEEDEDAAEDGALSPKVLAKCCCRGSPTFCE